MTDQNPWARTYSGGVFHPLNPIAEEVTLDDIFIPLANTCRYNGGVRMGLHYSVAEHSVHIARKLRADFPDDPVLALQGLMHDAAEAYIGDMIRPVKSVFPEFRALEDRINRVIFEKFAIPYPWPAIIDEYDARICLDEEAQALRSAGRKFEIPGGPLGITLEFWDPLSAVFELRREFWVLGTAPLDQDRAAYKEVTS